MLPTIAWDGDEIVMIDQRKLPGREVYVRCKSGTDVAKAITTMVIRGAPAIGVAAAMGLALGAQRTKATGTRQFVTEFQRLADVLAATRPTAVNLFWAIERMKQAFAAGAHAGESVQELTARLRCEADRIHDEDVASCRAIGRHGAALLPDEARVLTHCNAGALATAGFGTALGVIRGAVEAGKSVTVLADETRPFLQGARLTAWELVKDGIATTVITDNMSAAMMASASRQRGGGRRRPHRRQRRHGQQDRHLRRGDPGPGARHPVLRRRPVVHGGSRRRRPAPASRSRSAAPPRSRTWGATSSCPTARRCATRPST